MNERINKIFKFFFYIQIVLFYPFLNYSLRVTRFIHITITCQIKNSSNSHSTTEKSTHFLHPTDTFLFKERNYLLTVYSQALLLNRFTITYQIWSFHQFFIRQLKMVYTFNNLISHFYSKSELVLFRNRNLMLKHQSWRIP